MNQTTLARKGIDAVMPLSPLQEGILFHSIQDPESNTYVVQYSAIIEGELDATLVERCWQETVTSHDALRTNYVWETTAQPLQVVRGNIQSDLVKISTHELDRVAASTITEDLLVRERQSLADMKAARLIRAALVKQADNQHLFVLTYHHILLDGWSLFRILEEISTRYAAYKDGCVPVIEGAPSIGRLWSGCRRKTPVGRKTTGRIVSPDSPRLLRSHRQCARQGTTLRKA